MQPHDSTLVSMHVALQGFVKVAVQTGASLVPVRVPSKL